ncbi:MAG: hypothetical protein OXC94_11780 [Chloroflexi bacterium]|nr:hypothetical protein [Chloroflexota bacterium]
MAAVTDIGERVARLEADRDHMATKADIERLRAELQRGVLGLAGLIIAGVGAILAALRVWL